MTRIARAAPLVLLVALAGCGSSQPWEGTALDQPAWTACQGWAQTIHDSGGAEAFYAVDEAARRTAVDEVTPNLGGSAWPLAKDSAAVLQRVVDGPAQSWKLGVDTLAARCLSAGWRSS